MNKLKILEEKAHRIVQKVADSPQERYQLRFNFYEEYGNPVISRNEGLGNSELAFIQWEIRRGTLNSLTDPKPGSPWWRKVNSHFLFCATLAQLIDQSGEVFNELSGPVRFWLDYINKPNECTWYRAHNSSIISGYLAADSLAYDESIYEQYFMNIVLYRVLYAQSMVEGMSFGLLGKIFANPRGDAVSLITDIEAFYPSHYPLTSQDINYVTHKAHNLLGLFEDVFDKLLILPSLSKLYQAASNWNDSPVLMKFINGNKPIYPISVDEASSYHFNNELRTHQLQIPNT